MTHPMNPIPRMQKPPAADQKQPSFCIPHPYIILRGIKPVCIYNFKNKLVTMFLKCLSEEATNPYPQSMIAKVICPRIYMPNLYDGALGHKTAYITTRFRN